MYLEILPIAMIFILTKKKNTILSHIASINPLFTNFTIEKQSATTIFNITEHWHRWPHCKERDPHVKKKNSTETMMNETLITKLAPTLNVRVFVINQPQTEWINLQILLMLLHKTILDKYNPWKINWLHLRILDSRPKFFLDSMTMPTKDISETLIKTSLLYILNCHHHWGTRHMASSEKRMVKIKINNSTGILS